MKLHSISILVLYLGLSCCSDNKVDKIKTKAISVDSSTTTKFSADTSVLFSLSDVTKVDFENAKNRHKDKITYDTAANRKVGDQLKLLTRNKVVLFTDRNLNPEETDFREYQYQGQLSSINYYIVREDYYEGMRYFLVNKQSGRQTETWNEPKLSPAERYLANLSMPFGLEGVPNGIQIWGIDKQEPGLSKLIEIDQESWVPHSFYWDTDNTLILNVSSIDDYYQADGQPKEKGNYYLRLTVK